MNCYQWLAISVSERIVVLCVSWKDRAHVRSFGGHQWLAISVSERIVVLCGSWKDRAHVRSFGGQTDKSFCAFLEGSDWGTRV